MVDWNELAFYLAKLRLTHPEILDKELPVIMRRGKMRLITTPPTEPPDNEENPTRYIMSTSGAKKAGKVEKA